MRCCFQGLALDFLPTLASSAGALQPLYFGTHEGAGARGLYLQGRAYGMNGEALRRVLSACAATLAADAPLPPGSDGWNGDALMGGCARAAGAHIVHCGHFRAYAPAYVKANGARTSVPAAAQPRHAAQGGQAEPPPAGAAAGRAVRGGRVELRQRDGVAAGGAPPAAVGFDGLPTAGCARGLLLAARSTSDTSFRVH